MHTRHILRHSPHASGRAAGAPRPVIERVTPLPVGVGVGGLAAEFSACTESGAPAPRHGVRILDPVEWVSQTSRALDDLAARYPAATSTYVHPCVIDGDAYLIHERGLEERDPQAYAHLARLARQMGVRIRADRRQKDVRVSGERRRRWVLVLAITIGTMSGVGVMASETGSARPTTPANSVVEARAGGHAGPESERPSETTVVAAEDGRAVHDGPAEPGSPWPKAPTGRPHERLAAVGLIPVAGHPPEHVNMGRKGSPGSEPFEIHAPPEGLGEHPPQEARPLVHERIRALLQSRYQRTKGDPSYVWNDLDKLAAYYSTFPQAVELLLSLEAKSWRLTYRKDTWMTRASGTRVSVNTVRILFDTRAAAQLRFRRNCTGSPRCVISPADALLHELLHARKMLLEPDRFIAQGGMGGVLYPYIHEADVISAENALYAAMVKTDGLERPQRPRHKHIGKMLRASCAVCIN